MAKQPASLEYILMRSDEGAGRDLERNKKFDRIEQLRYRKHTVQIPERWRHQAKEVKVPLVDDVLRVVTSVINQSWPQVRVPPIGKGRAAVDNASKREK
jgi:hypothetical protein